LKVFKDIEKAIKNDKLVINLELTTRASEASKRDYQVIQKNHGRDNLKKNTLIERL